MAEINITLKYDPGQQVDLALPAEVPSQFLARSLGQALGIRVPENQILTLSVDADGTRRKLSPASTLTDARVLNGSYLILAPEAAPAGLGAYLLSDSGVKFLLRTANVVGRQDSKSRVHLEVDLTPLDGDRVVSRRHAQITLKEGSYYIQDTKSRNGVWLNGKKLPPGKEIPINSGDRLEFGPEGKGGISMIFVWQK